MRARCVTGVQPSALPIRNRKAGQEVVIYPGMAVCVLQECHFKFRRYIVIKRQAAAVCYIISRGLEAELRDKPVHCLPAIACRCASSSTDIVGGYMIEHGLGIEIVASLHLTVHNIKQSGFLCIYRCRATWHRTLLTVTGQEDSLMPESPFQSVCEFILSAHEQRRCPSHPSAQAGNLSIHAGRPPSHKGSCCQRCCHIPALQKGRR